MTRIRVDATRSSAVAVCADCPPWRELRGTRAAALTAAAAHALQAHGDQQLAKELRGRVRDIETRRAADAAE